MQLDSNNSGWAIPPDPNPTGTRNRVTQIIGIAMLLIPMLQLYFALRPWLALAEFLPMEMLISELSTTALIANAACIAGVLMMIGGLLLLLRSPWGWTLGISSMVFTLFWTLESLSFGAVMMMKDGGISQQMVEIIFEFLAMTFYAPVIFLVAYIIVTPWFFKRSVQAELQVRPIHKRIALAIGIFLLIDLHLTLFIFYNQSSI